MVRKIIATLLLLGSMFALALAQGRAGEVDFSNHWFKDEEIAKYVIDREGPATIMKRGKLELRFELVFSMSGDVGAAVWHAKQYYDNIPTVAYPCRTVSYMIGSMNISIMSFGGGDIRIADSTCSAEGDHQMKWRAYNKDIDGAPDHNFSIQVYSGCR